MVEVAMVRAVNTPVPGGGGYDNLAYLRELAGWVLASVAVLIVIAGAVSLVLWLVGKVSAHSKMQVTAMVVSFNIFIGSAILGSLGGLVYWGSGVGEFNLMPAGAQQPTVDVTKRPPLSTCSNSIDVNSSLSVIGLGSNPVPAVALRVLGQSGVDAVQQGGHTITRVTYSPQGPDCGAKDPAPDPCMQIKLVVLNAVKVGANVDADPVNKADCQS